MINVTIIPVLKDNYAYLLLADNGQSAILDPGESTPIIAYLDRENITPDFIINTHHHWDHTDGNEDIVKRYGSKLIGPTAEADLIPGLDIMLDEDNGFTFGEDPVQIIETPGHTAGHICLYFPESKIVFTGDTLFLMSCGRLFEGTPEDMFGSFAKLKTLPDDTRIYCGHEYTVSNAKFALKLDPNNQNLRDRYERVKALRRKKTPTMPATMLEEKQTNPFMRAETVDEFARIRKMKDNA